MRNSSLTATMLLGIAALSAGIVACAKSDLPAATQVQKDFEAALKVGDSSEKIEAVFKSRQLGASYDKYSNRYNSTMRSPKTDFHAISIVVHLDAERRFTSVEAFDSYTMP